MTKTTATHHTIWFLDAMTGLQRDQSGGKPIQPPVLRCGGSGSEDP